MFLDQGIGPDRDFDSSLIIPEEYPSSEKDSSQKN
jgi:hypothetical protein